MNKLILSIATVLMMSAGAFAADKNDDGTINEQALKVFRQEFIGASDVSWEQRTGYAHATFSLHGQVLNAYFNDNGDLQAVVRNIVSYQLPISLLSGLKGGYEGYWISDLFEMVSDGQTAYYATVENSDKKLVLKSDGALSWTVFNKQKKEEIQ